MQTTTTVGNSNPNLRIATYTATTGEKFEVFETFDLMNKRSIEVFPYTTEGKLRTWSIAKADDFDEAIKHAEDFLAREAKIAEEKKGAFDPVKAALNKGKADARAGKSKNDEWLKSVSQTEQEAYEFTYSKYQ
ncbi:hypothetical protein [Vibrio barjaei]|uniref:hypothetical protein n=1 Tax=Vibrio barjaei TaxID=1676683 RepID=UPI0022836E1F|nr:hypothetical protein [Vibrio barjaei]MCY9874032.1 hypothetical protein [Vibrio barjaei]